MDQKESERRKERRNRQGKRKGIAMDQQIHHFDQRSNWACRPAPVTAEAQALEDGDWQFGGTRLQDRDPGRRRDFESLLPRRVTGPGPVAAAASPGRSGGTQTGRGPDVAAKL
jgi:hypothetical protein